MVNYAFDKARQEWANKLKSLSLHELLETDEPEERLKVIMEEIKSFRKMKPIIGYFEEAPSSVEEEYHEPSELIIQVPNQVKSAPTEYPDNYFTFKRMVRGGELININDPSRYTDQVYIPEHVVRDFGLVTGTIVEATIDEFTNGNSKNTITHIVEQALTEETFKRFEYPYLIAEKNEFGEFYASRMATGGYAKNEDGDILRFPLSQNDVNRYRIEKGSIVDIAVDLESNYHCVAFVHRTDEIPTPTPVAKKKKPKDVLSTTEESESTMLEGIDYDLERFKGKSFVLMSGEYLSPRYEQLFIDELGMELHQFNTDTETHQMAQKIESGVDYAIACPAVVNHDATNLFKDAAKRSKIHYTFSRYDGPKQVLLSLIELDKRIQANAS